ncbi:uncharacterized protein LOC106663112, partial [Cimex lectularius]|uniref:Endosome-associated-trafficking regulator 1 n=1 Tax=Cimex lectularius TaxID=79782 RepID=A0A8I6TLX4_CIMLE
LLSRISKNQPKNYNSNHHKHQHSQVTVWRTSHSACRRSALCGSVSELTRRPDRLTRSKGKCCLQSSPGRIPVRRVGKFSGEGSCFSFRHFLRESDTPRQPQQGEGLPPGTPPPSPRLDMASALPDFVQDHLVMEQSYLGSPSGSGAFRLENIPQHLAALQRDGDFPVRGDIPFDLMASNNPQRQQGSDASGSITSNGASDIQSSSKRLPDFLSDGPIRRETPQQANPLQIENERLQEENERMRLELEMLRQQLSQQVQRNESLEVELNRQMSRERSNPTLHNNEKLEDELFKMTKRAMAAENRAAKLKEYVDSLSQAQCGSMGAASTSAHQTQSERLASQLRNAANTAEVSLRQLLNGVENLRYLANTLEPVHPAKVVASDSDEDYDTEMTDSNRPGGSYR